MPQFPAAMRTWHARKTDTSRAAPEERTNELGLITVYDPEPNSSVADIVFIHGLKGGSKKTWSYSKTPNSFWPQDWLPTEQGLQDVRIHSFGYKADWGERQKSILNIHDFADSLIGGLRNNPSIRRDNTRIILVGHSMGGCVAKEAYIIARQHPSYQDLARRIYGIFFLGTPHHGSDLARILENVLIASWGRKPFVTDLKSGSSALAMINDRFRHVAEDLALWTFYETLPATLGPMSRIVVEKNSAILGYDEERIEAMNADHRHLCKFTNREDSNYKILRNALHTAVDEIKKNILESTPLHTRSALQLRLTSFLGVCNTFESDLATRSELKIPDSCEWFTRMSCFTSWRAGESPGILWLTGRPAGGKSILSSHVIDQLTFPNACCSFYFFKHSTTDSTLSGCFRSLALQMAMQDSLIMEKLLQFEDEGIVWDKADDVVAWTKLFVERIFKLPLKMQHFWVIDGLDECTQFNSLFTRKLLTKLPHKRELRVFFTSRNMDTIERGLASIGTQVNVYAMSDSDTRDDIRLFLTTKLRELDRLETDADRAAMCNKILEKSSGSFLWVRLVLQEFENAWTEEAMETILKEVPGELCDLYGRMVHSIEMDRSKTNLAKCILTWVVLARRPLTLDELRCIVKLDLNQTLQNIKKAIPSLCEQLVYVDHTDKAHIIHETAREFLLDGDMCSKLGIDQNNGHAHIGSVLTRFLSGSAFKAQQAKPTTFAISGNMAPLDASLLGYASTFFSEHIYQCSLLDDGLINELCTFLKKNVLLWIEYMAKSNDLSKVTQTAMNLRGYLGRQPTDLLPTNLPVGFVTSWVTDLIHVAAKFQPQLLTCPRSIYRVVPPLCPPESMISKTFSGSGESSTFVVKGLPVGTWEDCLSRIDFPKGQATAVSHGKRFFAVGLSTGQIYLFSASSVQHLWTVTHPERVKILEFCQDDQYIASCGTKSMTIWEPKSGIQIYSFPLKSPPLGLLFLGVEEILCAFQSGEIAKWSLMTIPQVPWKIEDSYSHTQCIVPKEGPMSMAFITTTNTVLLAMGYRKHPILIWNALERQLLGQCIVDANNGIDRMAFNPNPDVVALVVSCNDGRLCLYDYTTMALTFMAPNVYAQRVACSPDGRSLVTGSSHGMINVFEFDHDSNGSVILKPIHRLNAMDNSIRGVAFSFDGSRFLDVHSQQCRVWEPTVLLRKSDEVRSTNDAVPLPVMTVGMSDNPDEPEITSQVITTADGQWAIAGKRCGAVCLFSTEDGKEVGTLYQHARGASVVVVVLGEACNLIISADDSGRVLVGDLAMPPIVTVTEHAPGRRILTARAVLDSRFGATVLQLLVNNTADRLLICGHKVEELWELPSGKVLARREPALVSDAATLQPPIEMAAFHTGLHLSNVDRATQISSTYAAFQHPTNSVWFVVVGGDVAHVYAWVDFEALTSADGIRFERPPASTESSQSARVDAVRQPTNTRRASAITSYHVGSGLVIEFIRSSASGSTRICVWPAQVFDPDSQKVSVLPATELILDAVSPVVRSVVGFTGPTTLVFLDINLWVCSTELKSAFTKRYDDIGGLIPLPLEVHARRHFFALSEWRNAEGELNCALVGSSAVTPHSNSRGVVFVNGHRLVVVKGGFEFSEKIVVLNMTPETVLPLRG